MTDEEIAWLAGLCEGEASFSSNRSQRQSRPSPRLQVVMGDKDVLERIVAITGQSHVLGPLKTREVHHTPMYYWQKTGPRAAEIIRAIYPLLGVRRRACIERIFAECNLELC